MRAQRVSTLEIRKRLRELLDLLRRRYVLEVLEGRRSGRLSQAKSDRLADGAKHAARTRELLP